MTTLLLLAACETSTSIQKTWIGQTDTYLMSSWGAPDLQANGDGGTKVLTYQGRNRQGVIVCRRNFTVDDEHRIIAVSHNCPI